MSQEYLQDLERVAAAARDSLTDDMVTRLSGAAAEGLDLLDRINRSGVAAALPAISELVRNGDLDRLVAIARAFGAAQDAATDEMVARLTDAVAGALSLADRVNRAGADRIVGALERLTAGGGLDRLEATIQNLASGMSLLERVMGALDAAAAETRGKAAAGGVGGMWRLLTDAQNQQTLRFLLAVGRRLQAGGKAA